MVWRLPLLARDASARKELVEAVRKLGALASDHYFPVSFLMGDSSCAGAREIGLRALNLWVDAKTDRDLLAAVCAEVNRLAC
jgi:hypothetical protein